MKELAIGEEIRIKIKCVEDKRSNCCKGCYFEDSLVCQDLKCCGSSRKDGKNVHFELVED